MGGYRSGLGLIPAISFEQFPAVTLVVTDNGLGFLISHDLQDVNANHWRLHGMRERASAIDSVFECSSHPAAGTRISVNVPSRIAFLKPSRRNVSQFP